MRSEVSDRKSLFEFFSRKSAAKVLTEARHAMVAVAIVPIKVIRNKSVRSASDAAAHQGFQHLTPMRIIQTSPILAHAANAVGLVRDGHSRFVLFQQIHGISHRLRAEQFFIPLIAIKAEESAR